MESLRTTFSPNDECLWATKLQLPTVMLTEKLPLRMYYRFISLLNVSGPRIFQAVTKGYLAFSNVSEAF